MNKFNSNSPNLLPKLDVGVATKTTTPVNSIKSPDELLSRYNLGERKFTKAQLAKLNLSNANLQCANLSEADLRFTNLKNANLSNANLSNACLDGADLTGANLQGALLKGASLKKTCLSGANLSKAYLTEANLDRAFLSETILQGTNLQGASLVKAHLNSAILDEARLSKANLNGAYLIKASLKSTDLTSTNLAGAWLNGAFLHNTVFTGAYYNQKTCFEPNFNPSAWDMKQLTIETIQDLMNAFNCLSQNSCRYLGNIVTSRHWQKSRPAISWLERFQINSQGQFTFNGDLRESLSTSQLEQAQEWIEGFTDYSSAIIAEFSKLLDKDKSLSLF
ncbi:MAG: hypothetical protein N5P05_003241 [Chroococcopsis gigantea SAG 12.99]|jgi:uncharacterized protein YjbI with pentapeptide repeats|nr:pentapeptide repeat-containing protein [Chlorogloea purpurea SAG 13.99]MDV3001635.1 hypothetical protein [Chroococcopsis gigantea SAG 12.99]